MINIPWWFFVFIIMIILLFLILFSFVCVIYTVRFAHISLWYKKKIVEGRKSSDLYSGDYGASESLKDIVTRAVFLDEFQCKLQRQFQRELVCLASVFTLNFMSKENENYSFIHTGYSASDNKISVIFKRGVIMLILTLKFTSKFIEENTLKGEAWRISFFARDFKLVLVVVRQKKK